MEGYSYEYSGNQQQHYASPYTVHNELPYKVPDHGDGFGDYYAPRPHEDELKRPSCSKYRSRKREKRSHSRSSKKSRSRSRSRSRSKSRSRSRSKSRSRSRSKSRSRSRSRSRSLSGSHSGRRELTYKEPSILDAFRVMYLSPSKHKKSTTKYLVTKKKQDRVQELLKRDGLGSKHWFFYPRNNQVVEEPTEPVVGKVPGPRDNCDQRIKVDAVFFRKYKKNRKVDMNAPAAKLKRLELILYRNLGFIQAI